MSDVVTQAAAITQLAREGESPETLGLVASLFDRNARDLVWTFEQLYEGEKAAHEQTQERLRLAHLRLALIERRADWLMGLTDDWRDEDFA